MELIGVAYAPSDLIDAHVGKFQHLRRLVHPEIDKELLQGLVHRFPEDLSQIAPVQIAEAGDIFNGDRLAAVLLNKSDRLADIKILQFSFCHLLLRRGRLDQLIQEQIQMADLVQGRSLFIVRQGQQFIFQKRGLILFPAAVNRGIIGKACGFHIFLGPYAVKFHPCIFPRFLFVRHVSGDLLGIDDKSLPRL